MSGDKNLSCGGPKWSGCTHAGPGTDPVSWGFMYVPTMRHDNIMSYLMG